MRATVLAVVIVVRIAWVMIGTLIPRLFRRRDASPSTTTREALLISWCGMRGLVTLATAFALPSGFPHRDVIVLSAFIVVLGSLIIQGLTVGLLIKLLRARAGQFTRGRDLEGARRDGRGRARQPARPHGRCRRCRARRIRSDAGRRQEPRESASRHRARSTADRRHLRAARAARDAAPAAERSPTMRSIGWKKSSTGPSCTRRRAKSWSCSMRRERPGEAYDLARSLSDRRLRAGCRNHLHRFHTELLTSSAAPHSPPERRPGFGWRQRSDDFDLVIGVRLQVDGAAGLRFRIIFDVPDVPTVLGAAPGFAAASAFSRIHASAACSRFHAAGIGHLVRGRRRRGRRWR